MAKPVDDDTIDELEITLKAGEKLRFYCEECSREFDIVFEPKVAETKGEKPAFTDAPLHYCPSCGEQELSL